MVAQCIESNTYVRDSKRSNNGDATVDGKVWMQIRVLEQILYEVVLSPLPECITE